MKELIKINTNVKTGTLNPKMWGIFYEEINHSGDGGIYAELIRNRNFAESNIPEGTTFSNGKVQTRGGHIENFNISDQLPAWKLQLSYSSNAIMKKVTSNPRNETTPEQLQLTVVNVGEGVKLINSGYWGISTSKIGYHGFIIVRSKHITNIKLGIMFTNGIEICSTIVENISNEFKKIEYTLNCSIENKDSKFFVEVNNDGELYIDFISLFPNNTYKNRKYGLRNDLVEMLKCLNPGFLRFPGGCVVEGISLQNAIHWKNTIGRIEDRIGHWDLWNYRCSDGLGMHEFLQLCEDLNAPGMYVVNCGMSCQGRSMQAASPDDVDKWLQDALDGIEYAIGDIDTTWGATRAKNGHPNPFNIKYVEIGNENSGEVYFERYRKFYKVIKEKYPQLELIANCFVPDAQNDMVDDHYYTLPQFFPQIFDEYKNRDKKSSKVYIGEYACNQEVEYGNLLSAISESVFMIGMERSCDVIEIASYAPLFCNVNDRKWPVNLINFDNEKVFGIPSYYCQKIFSENMPETVVETNFERKSNATSQIFATAGLTKDSDELIIKVACFGSDSVTADIKIDGINVSEKATEILIAGENGTETNSLLNSKAVCDVSFEKSVSMNSITHTFPPCSLTFFRVKTI